MLHFFEASRLRYLGLGQPEHLAFKRAELATLLWLGGPADEIARGVLELRRMAEGGAACA